MRFKGRDVVLRKLAGADDADFQAHSGAQGTAVARETQAGGLQIGIMPILML